MFIIMILSLLGAAIVAIETFKKDLFDKAKNNMEQQIEQFKKMYHTIVDY